jgi:mono/diheme cytochrome c family protein
VEWNGPALDKINGNLITGAVDICFIVTLGDTVYTAGELNFGCTVVPDGEATGWITAIDSLTGDVKWRLHTNFPVVAGITPTAGGITFAGDLGGNFFALDSATGDILYQVNAGGALAGGVITYELDGIQYVATNAGNISRNAFGDVGLPSVVIWKLSPLGIPTTINATTMGARDMNNGRRLYSQVCSSCHGTDGNFVPEHHLGDLASRMSFEEAVSSIKIPTAPMPALYPDLISEQDVQDVTRFVFDEL